MSNSRRPQAPSTYTPSNLKQFARPKPEKEESFREFSASELYCPKCGHSMPVREKMLLVLPGGELYDYACTRCGTTVGTRKTN